MKVINPSKQGQQGELDNHYVQNGLLAFLYHKGLKPGMRQQDATDNPTLFYEKVEQLPVLHFAVLCIFDF